MVSLHSLRVHSPITQWRHEKYISLYMLQANSAGHAIDELSAPLHRQGKPLPLTSHDLVAVLNHHVCHLLACAVPHCKLSAA